MGKRRKKGKGPTRQHPSTAPPSSDERQKSGATHKHEALTPKTGRFQSKRPVLRFGLIFILCAGLFYGCEATSPFKKTVFPAYCGINASISAAILNCFGEQATAQDTLVTSPRFSIEVRRGCDAVEPSALFMAAIIASPVLIWTRLVGLIAGTILLMLINLIRIVSLFYVGVFYPTAFEVVHLDVWQALFIFLLILFWAVWVRWAKRVGIGKHDVPV